MRTLKLLLATALLAGLLTPVPAQAGSESGSILLPNYSDAIAIVLDDIGLNGLAGYVIEFDEPLANGTEVVLRDESPEPVELDVLFYGDADQPMSVCRDAVQNDGDRREKGVVSCDEGGAGAAVVTMLYLLGGEFRLTWD